MTSVRMGDQNELSGAVEKRGRHKSKSVAGAKVTVSPTRPAQLSNMPASAMKSEQPSARRGRIKHRYSGWGQTVKGNEGGSQSCGTEKKHSPY